MNRHPDYLVAQIGRMLRRRESVASLSEAGSFRPGTGLTPGETHDKAHGHDGADGSGTVAHADVSGKTANDHHAQAHAAAHADGGADEVAVEGLPTAAADTALVLAPDGLGGVEFRAEAGGGAPTDADYLVGTANAGLSAEIVVGPTPGGELGGTWGSPTVDATHSGSAHHAEFQVPVTWGPGDTARVDVTGTGSVNNPQQAGQRAARISGGNTTGSTASLRVSLQAGDVAGSSGQTGVHRLRSWWFTYRGAIVTDTSRAIYIFLTNAWAAGIPSLTVRHLGIRRASTGETYFTTADGTTEQTTDISVSADFANVVRGIRITFDDTSARCYVNGTLVATHSTNIPSTEASKNPVLHGAIEIGSNNNGSFELGPCLMDFAPL